MLPFALQDPPSSLKFSPDGRFCTFLQTNATTKCQELLAYNLETKARLRSCAHVCYNPHCR